MPGMGRVHRAIARALKWRTDGPLYYLFIINFKFSFLFYYVHM